MATHLEKAIEEIDDKIADLKRLRDGMAKVGGTLVGGVKRTISAKARKAISVAQKKRWAVLRKQGKAVVKATSKKLKALV